MTKHRAADADADGRVARNVLQDGPAVGRSVGPLSQFEATFCAGICRTAVRRARASQFVCAPILGHLTTKMGSRLWALEETSMQGNPRS